MLNIGDVTANARKKTALPFPSTPYAGTAPITSSPSQLPPISTPSTVGDALKNTNQTLDQAKGSVAATQPFLDNYLKPNAAGTTPFRQALTNTKASTTADAYDNAVARTRERAQATGFASNPQPVTFGAETGLANERAKAIADIPNQVNLQAQPVEFQAANMQQNQAGIYNALANTQQGEAGILAGQKTAADAQKAALFGGLANTAIGVGTPLIKAALQKTPTPPYAGTPISPGDPNFMGPVQPPSPMPGDPNFTGPVQQPPQQANLPGSLGEYAGPVGGIGAALAGTSLAGGGAAGLGTATSVGLDFGAGAELAGSWAGGAGAAGATAGADATAAGATAASSGSLGATLGALATNPITWAVAGSIAAAILWRKSQVHPTADTFVQTYQNPFGQHLGSVVNNFDAALASGKLDKASAQALRDETAKLIDGFKQDTNAFSQQGGHENQVAHQAMQTMAQNFGQNWEGILGKMDQSIAGLA